MKALHFYNLFDFKKRFFAFIFLDSIVGAIVLLCTFFAFDLESVVQPKKLGSALLLTSGSIVISMIVSGNYRNKIRFTNSKTIASNYLYLSILSAIWYLGYFLFLQELSGNYLLSIPVFLFFAINFSRFLLYQILNRFVLNYSFFKSYKPKLVFIIPNATSGEIKLILDLREVFTIEAFLFEDPISFKFIENIPCHQFNIDVLKDFCGTKNIDGIIVGESVNPSTFNIVRSEMPNRVASISGSVLDLMVRRNRTPLDAPNTDLLNRDLVNTDSSVASQIVTGKTVLVTGGAGTIGSQIVIDCCRFGASAIVVIDVSEFAVFELKAKIKELYGKSNITYLLGDVRDLSFLERVFASYNPHVVVHSAACKHVNIVEENSAYAIGVNFFGTKNLVDISIRNCIDVFVLISTDKAVNPSTIMGSTKRLAEIYCQRFATTERGKSDSKLLAVRFGNVLRSSGSVVPIFERQIANGGPVTITHPEITRYFMSVEEASGLVLQGAALGDTGDILLLDMGVPVKIVDVAKMLIFRAGLTVKDKKSGKGDIELIFTGLQPNEKLNEELLIGLKHKPTANKKIVREAKKVENFKVMDEILDDLKFAVEAFDNVKSAKLLNQIIEGIDRND